MRVRVYREESSRVYRTHQQCNTLTFFTTVATFQSFRFPFLFCFFLLFFSFAGTQGAHICSAPLDYIVTYTVNFLPEGERGARRLCR